MAQADLVYGEGGSGRDVPSVPPGPSYAGQAKPLSAQVVNVPFVIAYGYVRAVGAIRRIDELPDKSKLALSVLGSGEWDGIERFWLYRRLLSGDFSSIVHFHPGVLPALGSGLAETSTGGNNGVDSFFSYLPAKVPRITLPRMAYVWVKAAPDPRAAYPDLEFFGDYRALKVRDFDAAGAQTAYAWSLNPIRQALDLRFRLQLMREGLPGEEPPASVKARVDWPAYYDAVAYCNEVLANGKPRFICSKWWTDTKKLKEMESEILMTCRGFVTEPNGKIQYRIDKPRATTFAMTGEHVRAVSVQFHEKNIESAKNRYIGNFRDVNPMAAANIVSITRTNGTVVVQTDSDHGFMADTGVEVIGVGPNSFNGSFRIVAVPDSTHLSYAQAGVDESGAGGVLATPESRFAERSVILDHKAHQLLLGVRGVGIAPQARQEDAVWDFGASTWDQVFRVLKYMMLKDLGPDQIPYKAPIEGTIACDLYGVDSADRALAAQIPGDTIALDSTVSDEFAGDFEIMVEKLRHDPGGEGGQDGGAIEVELHEYNGGIFPDASDDEPAMVPLPMGTGLPGVSTFEGDGTQYKARTAVHSNAGPTTFPLLGVALTGTTGKIVVDPFVMRVGGRDISCLSSSYEIVSGITQGQKYFVYYDDAYFMGGEITPQATQDPTVLKASSGRFMIGEVLIPFASPSMETLRPTSYSDGPEVATANPTAAYDANDASAAVVRSLYSSPDMFAGGCTWKGFPARTIAAPSSIHLKIKWQAAGKPLCGVSINYSLDGGATLTTVPGFPKTSAASGTADIALSTSQLTQNIRVTAFTDPAPNKSNEGSISIFEIWVEVS